MVNHPAHYTQHESGVECIEVKRTMDAPNLADAFKYLFRAGKKGGDLATHRQDLAKARFYVLDQIALLRDEPASRVDDFLKGEPDEVFHYLLAADESGDIQSLSAVLELIDQKLEVLGE